MIEQAKDNLNRFNQLRKDFLQFAQLYPQVTKFSQAYREETHEGTFLSLEDHQRFYFLKSDLIKFIPLSFIIALPMTCFILPYYILKFPHKIPS